MFYDILQVVKFGFYVTREALQSEVTGLNIWMWIELIQLSTSIKDQWQA
jgi:hypothetical protein